MAGKIFRQIDGRKKDTDNIPPKAEIPYGHRKRKPSINSGLTIRILVLKLVTFLFRKAFTEMKFHCLFILNYQPTRYHL